MNLSRCNLYYKGRGRDTSAITARMLELAQKYKRWGAPRMHAVLKREGLVKNHKQTERLYYRVLKLSIRRKARKKLRSQARESLAVAVRANQRWSMDFIFDVLENGRRIKSLNIVDDYTRECLAAEIDTSLGGLKVVRILDMLRDMRGLPEAITMDNGPEFTSRVMDEWAWRNKVKLAFIDPGKPVQNAYAESFNDKIRKECFNENWFPNLGEARRIVEEWRNDYNSFRPHSSLGNLTPQEFAARAVNA